MTEITLPDESTPYVRIDAVKVRKLTSVDLDKVAELYRCHGALLLCGFEGGLDDFRAFANHFCPVAVHNESRNRANLGEGQVVQSVNLGTRAFPLHPELSREPWKPDTCFFYCLNPPMAGGATTICDGVEIVRRLPAELVSQMAARRLKYVLPAVAPALKYWLGTERPDEPTLRNPPPSCPFRFEHVGKQLARTFTRPLLHKPMFIDELAFGNFLLFARYLRGVRNFPLLDDGSLVPSEWVEAVKEVSDSLTVPIQWQAGDLLMIDNSRFMHGRTEVSPGDGRLIATYFGYLKFAEPNPEEPANPIWRSPGFVPPATGAAASD